MDLSDFDRRDWFFPVVAMRDEEPYALRGTAFCIAPGWLLTCRHVAETDETLTVHDPRVDDMYPVADVVYPSDKRSGLDLALIPNPLERKVEPLPVTTSEAVSAGSTVFAYGWFSRSPVKYHIEGAFLSGNVFGVNLGMQTDSGHPDVVLPFPIIEGMSGAPLILARAEGIGVVGVCYGSRQQRAVASEFIDVRKDGEEEYAETTWRIVELGLAVHINPVARFLSESGIEDLRWSGF